MSKPIIGITANILVIEGPAFPGLRRVYINQDYVTSVIQAGAIPLLLPVLPNADDAARLVEGLDGLLVSGGADVHPSAYGQESHPLLEQTFVDRDTSDQHYLKQALGRNIPVLGICRGLQILNVFRGGTLHQDLSLAALNPPVQHRQPTLDRSAPAHSVRFEPGSLLHGIYGERLMVNSFHHQGLNTLGSGLTAVGWSPDGLVEAVEERGPTYLVAVQWHPEMLAADGDSNARLLFEDFVRRTLRP